MSGRSYAGPGPRAEEVRLAVSCEAVLARAGYALDRAGSSPTARRFKRERGEVVVVVQEGRGWFDPLRGGREGRGDVLSLAEREWGLSFPEAVEEVASMAGEGWEPPAATARRRCAPAQLDARAAWGRLARLEPGSPGWRYLTEVRRLPGGALVAVARLGVLAEGIRGTVCALHADAVGTPLGWEMRGPEYKGYSRGGKKGAFLLAPFPGYRRLAVTEGFIDAISLGVIEGWRRDTAYASTDGGFGQGTERVIRMLARGAGCDGEVVAATDPDHGGELLAARIADVARCAGARCERLRPDADDWNDVLSRIHRRTAAPGSPS